MNLRSLTSLLVALFVAFGSPGALAPDEWHFRQTIQVAKAGLVRLQLPTETLNAARPDLADLRILDAAGSEVPYLVDRAAPQVASAVAPKEFRTELETVATQLMLTTGTEAPIKGVFLQTAAAAEFIKAVRVEGSHDARHWEPLAGGQPIFRMAGGAANLHVGFPQGAWEFLRLTVDDSRAAAVPFVGAQLEIAEAKAAEKPFVATIQSRDESFGKTRLAIDLGAANLTIASLRIETTEPLFARTVTIAVPDLTNEMIREQTLRTASIYRVDLNGKVEARLDVPIEAQIRGRELIVLIDNGDSPPLAIKSVEGERRLATLVFLAHEPGRYVLVSGNNQCAAPRYDLSGLAEQLKTAAGRHWSHQ